jgi:hypothetical protein
MHLKLRNQTNNEMQEWEVIVELHCIGSTVDLKQVYGQFVTARNCQEEDQCSFLFRFIYSYTGRILAHGPNIPRAARCRPLA